MIERYRYAALATATLGFFTYVFVHLSYPPMAEAVRTELGLSFTQSGLILSAFALTYLIFQVPGGIISDRFGGAILIYGCLGLMGAFAFVFPFFATFVSALTSRLVMGLAAGLLMPAAVKLIATHFESKRMNLAMGIFGSAWGLALTAVFVTIPAVTSGGNWRNGIHFVGVFALLSAGVTFFLLRGARTSQKANSGDKIRLSGFITRRLLALTLTNFASAAVIVGTIAWAPLFLATRLGLTEMNSGLIVAIFGITNVAASWTGGIAATRVSQKFVIMISAILSVTLPPLFMFVTSTPLALALIASIGWSTMFFFGPVFALVPYSVPKGQEPSSIVFGVFNTMSNLGQFVSPVVMGVVLDLTGSFELTFLALSAIAIVGVIGAAFLRIRN